jgi:hypothetical protein
MSTVVLCTNRDAFAYEARLIRLANPHHVPLVLADVVYSDEPFRTVVQTFRAVVEPETTRTPIPATSTNQQRSGTFPNLRLGTIMNTQLIKIKACFYMRS